MSCDKRKQSDMENIDPFVIPNKPKRTISMRIRSTHNTVNVKSNQNISQQKKNLKFRKNSIQNRIMTYSNISVYSKRKNKANKINYFQYLKVKKF